MATKVEVCDVWWRPEMTCIGAAIWGRRSGTPIIRSEPSPMGQNRSCSAQHNVALFIILLRRGLLRAVPRLGLD